MTLGLVRVSLELVADLNPGGLSCPCTWSTAHLPAAFSPPLLPCALSCPLATEIINQAHPNPQLSQPHFYLSTCNSPCSSPSRVSLGGWFTDSLNVRVLGDGGSGYFYFFHAFFFYGCIFNMGLSPVHRQTLNLSV